MRKCTVLIGLFVFLGACVVNAASTDVETELESLKKANKDLLQRVDALEKQVRKTQAGIFDMGGGATLTIDGDVRIRNENLHNSFDINSDTDDNWNCTRLRTRIGFNFDYQNTAGAYLRLGNEYRWGSWTRYNFWDADPYNVYVENAYVKLNLDPLFSIPVSIKAGRQDIIFGEGWLVLDGTPQDGSSTISFDAVRATLKTSEKTKVDFIFAKIADIGSGLGTKYSQAGDTDEDFYCLYLDSKEIPGLRTELYAMHRNKNKAIGYFLADVPPGQFGDPKLQTSVFGGRLTAALCKNVDWGMEGAYQTGQIDPEGGMIGHTDYSSENQVQRDAFGFYTWLKLKGKEMCDAMDPALTLRFDYMSGDDPDTKGKFEGFDSMYAEWPKYSELLIYQLWDPFILSHGNGAADPNMGAFSNMYFPSVHLDLTPACFDDKITTTFGYRYMLADEKKTPYGHDGREIGNLGQFLANYNITKGLSAHFLFDYFVPGSYYTREADDSWFARVQMMYKF